MTEPGITLLGSLRLASTLLRILLGLLLVTSGSTWLFRSDPTGHLATALAAAADRGATFDLYDIFLEAVVRPQVGLFARLVGLGELASGLSLLFGAATRLGAGVISFQFLNYGMLNGISSMVPHGILIALVVAPIVLGSARAHGLDRWLHRRFPGAPFF
ncbi:MAG: DoxX family protein [Myxococcota bacterium]